MQQMASRPFATINVALETDEEPPDLIGGNVKVRPTVFSDQSPPQRCGIIFLGWQADEQKSFIHHCCRPSSSLKWELRLVPINCGLWLQSRCSDRYSSHHLLYVIFQSELFKVIALVFNKPMRLNWALKKKSLMWCSSSSPNESQSSVCLLEQCVGHVMLKVGYWWATSLHYTHILMYAVDSNGNEFI